MVRLPIIVGFGGINPAGRSSFNHSYRRLIFDKLSRSVATKTTINLAIMMGIIRYSGGIYKDLSNEQVDIENAVSLYRQIILDHTLVRRINDEHFDINCVPFQKKVTLSPSEKCSSKFIIQKSQLPVQRPNGCQYKSLDNELVEITFTDNFDVLFPQTRRNKVQSAGQLPSGFNPGLSYAGQNHPRALQMCIYAASDAIQSTGIPWLDIQNKVNPDEVSVYASNVYGQLDDKGIGGMLKSWMIGAECNSKQIALGLSSMPADFVNSYVLGNVGSTGAHQGACATFLYNLEHAIQDIKAGKSRVAIVGTSEAPITPEIIEGFRAAGALTEIKDYMDGEDDSFETANHRLTSKPFDAKNCGFTIGESAHYVVLFDDQLALDLGANILGAVPEVFINADGNKKSIFAPGLGNYITFAKAVAAAQQLLGERHFGQSTYIQAHGTSTPLNRKTESEVFNSVATVFGIEQWPVAAVKCYVGHSIGSAAGDQLMSALGVWEHGWIPGISTLDNLAADVKKAHLQFSKNHIEVAVDAMQAAFINSKGFGGNNATALILSPQKTHRMLEKRHGKSSMVKHARLHEDVSISAASYDDKAMKGQAESLYSFDNDTLTGEELCISQDQLQIPGFLQAVKLGEQLMYRDMC